MTTSSITQVETRDLSCARRIALSRTFSVDILVVSTLKSKNQDFCNTQVDLVQSSNFIPLSRVFSISYLAINTLLT